MGVKLQTERGCRKKKHKVREREIETERQRRKRERVEGDCSPPSTTPPPPPPPAIPRLYLSKESSVLTQELKPLSPRTGAFCPGAPASPGAAGCEAWLASAKAARLSERQLSDYSPAERSPATGGMIRPLSPLPPSPLLPPPPPVTPGDFRADRGPDLFSSGI